MRNISIALIAAAMFLLPAGAKSQIKGQHLSPNEVSLGYGILPVTSWMDMITDMFILVGNGTLGNPETRNSSELGAFTASYHYRFNNILAVEVHTRIQG